MANLNNLLGSETQSLSLLVWYWAQQQLEMGYGGWKCETLIREVVECGLQQLAI